MKHFMLVFVSIFTFGAFAQTSKNCVTPISNYTFQQLYSGLSSKQGDAQKLMQSKRIAKENCLSTDQVKQIAEIFENDYNRLAFVQEAFDNTTDKDNFYEVYNSFTYFSTVFRLHDYVIAHKSGTQIITTNPQTNEMTFPPYDYPDFRKYYGKTACSNILPDQDFILFADKIFKENNEDKKLSIAYNTTFNNCLATAQVMKISSLFQNEANRLDFLKKVYTKIYDIDNYKFAQQVFSTENLKKELMNFIGTGSNVTINSVPACEVSQQEFVNIKGQISKQSFINTKINIAKQSIKSKKCFKTTQIIEILTLFPYSDSKLEMAKYAYDYTIDKDNYFKIVDSFSFSNDKDEFLRFLKTK